MEIVGFVGMSHAPHWDLDFNYRGPGERYVGAVAQARDRIAALEPDALVVFGPDHFRNFFFDTMPPFCIGADHVTAIGDYSAPEGDLPGMPELGRFVVEHVMDEGFDPAVSLRMGVDHGISQPYAAIAAGSELPILPIMLNCSGAAMASMRRCHEFGQAVGRAIRAAPMSGRVVIVGSGGLSHSPPSGSPYDTALTEDRRDYLINGRSRQAEYDRVREAKLAQYLRDGVTGPINEQWDAWFLAHLVSGDLEPLLKLTAMDVLREAGTGGQEVRAWIAAQGAWGGPATSSVYEAVPTWITGMGCVSAVA